MFKRWAFAFFALMVSVAASAEIIQVPSEYGDTPTGYWGHPNAKAVLISLPGGAGSVDIVSRNPERPSWIGAGIFDDGIDVVLMDSAVGLGLSNLGARYTKEHQARIKSVVEFYQNKLHKPIFMMGHSNSSISIAEFINKSPEHQKMLAGIILSSGRNETELDPPLNLPVLFLHHEDDPNGRWTAYTHSQSLYEDVKKFNLSPTEFATVHGGENGDASTAGHHMYQGSLEEATKYVYEFILKTVNSSTKK
jgi:hypothetical protein